MDLPPGSQLGPYEIVAFVGAGGMGAVYKGRDTRLGRTVALKILPPQYASDARLRLRFEREAKAVSSLAHPHICTLHDVGRDRGIDFLVMEYCEGPTLAERIAAGPLPLSEVLEYGAQIAGALSRAHRQNIIHRDLKPSNIMITKSGVKLLDFGLARTDVAQTDEPDQATVEQAITSEGHLPGTLAYMAPELFHGAAADARSDLFAFGLVLYEMLTGVRAFAMPARGALIAAILEGEPRPVVELNPDTPPLLEQLLRACLAKDPDRRIQNAHDALLQLQWIREGDSTRRPQPPRHRVAIAAAVVIAAAVGATAALLWPWKSRPAAPAVRRLAITLPHDVPITVYGTAHTPFALSPDGRALVYIFLNPLSGTRQLYLKGLDEERGRILPGTDDAASVFFSPDGQWVGFSTGTTPRRLKKVAVRGGPPLVIRDAASVSRGATWSEDGTLVFAERTAPNGKSALFRMRPSGAVERLTPPSIDARWPQFLPGGREVLCSISNAQRGHDVAVLRLEERKWRVLVENAWHPRYDPAGYIVFARYSTLFRVPFDATGAEVTGEAQPIQDDVAHLAQAFSADFDVSRGTIAYLGAADFQANSELAWLDRQSRITGIPDSRRAYDAGVRVSPDGQRVLSAIRSASPGVREIWVHELETALWNRVTENEDAESPIWSPDGNFIAYASPSGSAYQIFIAPRDGSEPPRQITRQPFATSPNSWSPDGRWLAAEVTIDRTAVDVWMLPAAGDSPSVPKRVIAATEASEHSSAFSPDGRWIAYVAAASGRSGIYVRAATGDGPRWRIGEGVTPRWSAGDEIVFADRGTIVAVGITTEPFSMRKPRTLFEEEFEGQLHSFDVAADGRILLVRADRPRTRTQIRVVDGLLPP